MTPVAPHGEARETWRHGMIPAGQAVAATAPVAPAPQPTTLALLAGPRKGPRSRPSLRALVANGADAAAFAFTLGLARVEQLFAKAP